MRLWDLLCFNLVILPVLTGGVWGRVAGARFEYTQPGIAALVLAAFAFWRWRKDAAFPEKSLILKNSLLIWRGWRLKLRSRPIVSLTLAWFAVSAAWFGAAWARHQAFHSGAADMGIFVNVLHNLSTKGFPLSSIKGGISFLADHQMFLLYPLSWIYRIAPGPAILLAIQAAALAAGGIALYLLTQQRLGKESPWTALLPLCYWAYAPVRAANLFDFHPEVLMLPLFLFSVYFLQEKRRAFWLPGILLFLAALCAKESAGPVAAGIGLAWIVSGRGSKQLWIFGALFIACGVAAFWFDTSFFPKWIGRAYAYGNVYEPFGSSLTELASAPLRHPAEFFSRLFGISRLKFLSALLLPFLFLPLLAPRVFVAALPGLLMLFLAAGTQRVSTGFHYAIEPAIGVLMALPFALTTFFAKKMERGLLWLFPLAALLCFGRSEIFHWRFHAATEQQAWMRDQVLPFLDKQRSVAASGALVPHLAEREWIHYLPEITKSDGSRVDCVVLNSEVNNAPLSEQESGTLQALLKNEAQLEFSCGSTQIYRWKSDSRLCLTKEIECPL